MHRFSKELKILIGVFLIVLSVGYFTGVLFIKHTTEFSPKGIQEIYLGNENVEQAKVMKFKKSKQEIITLIHTHILSLSVIFFIIGILLLTTNLPNNYKILLITEPLISLLITFGGIFLLWKGYYLMKYIIIFSGILMSFSYTITVLILFYCLFTNQKDHKSNLYHHL